jgi:iron complex outermembrane receptor protein
LRLVNFMVGLTAVAGAALSGQAFAQRASENVLSSADDAFGTKIGNDSVGLYDTRSARGFDPQAAGNIRLDGLYFDQQAIVGSRLQRGSAMRIGIAAQSYPFPAPTGIADITLAKPGDERSVAVMLQAQAPSGINMLSVDYSQPLAKDKLSILLGGAVLKNAADTRTTTDFVAWISSMKWRPTENTEIILFHYDNTGYDTEAPTSVFTAGAFLPPHVDPEIFFGQRWAQRSTLEKTDGVLAHATFSDHWRLQFGLFHSAIDRSTNYAILYRNTQPNGSALMDVVGFPPSNASSYSGEARLTGVYTFGSYRQTVHLALRGRDARRVFGGTNTVSFGPAQIGVYTPVPEPTFTFGPRDRDHVRQLMPGVSYIGQLLNVGEFSVGVQKVSFVRHLGVLGGTSLRTSTHPWIYNGTATFYATKDLAIYAGYTRGIEEFGVAPDNAANRGQPVPADLTSQVDAGIRYRVAPGFTVMAGVFEVKKPYFDRDSANVYTAVGDVRHRGVELSLTGKPMPNLTAVLGAVFLQARITGPLVTAGTLGEVPVGAKPRLLRANVQYDIEALRGLSADAQFEYVGAQPANRTKTLNVPSTATVALGVRYATKLWDVPTTFRAQVTNITDTDVWTVTAASGAFVPFSPRKFMMRVSADF